ncbi:testis-expressed protein 15 [Podarcis raffonei]|uniref:testis-expressed protein 15 n=1 Tax=Podarcis raffonei TaxID=65483 RepID=UPI0023296ABB|nr:testis-expressed protein 15 [Podarcis raffonei]
MVAVARQQRTEAGHAVATAGVAGALKSSHAKRRPEGCLKPTGRDEGAGKRDGGCGDEKVEDKIEKEPKMEVIQKNRTSNTKGIFLPDQSRLKKFTIPKRAPDKGLLTECSNNQRDSNEIKQRLIQSCLDKECNLESLWQFSKIKMVHNKDLEEEFVAKRTKLREAGRQDKETSSFLLVSNKEVSNICQNGLHTGHSKKEQLKIMKELGNPQLGIYLFRHIDVALNYASEHSIPIENIIIFRVLLGKVKKIQPPKGKKKVALDPTPKFDCHMSRSHPSVKDSLEDQAIGSLIYFYEYNEHSKPVDKPRQCLPYAVIEVKCINQKNATVSASASLQCRPQKLPKHVGRGRRLPLENCTRVTRIGKSQLIYEHFRKPTIGCAVNSENNASPSFSGGLQNWNSSIVETQMKPKSTGRWDSPHKQTNEINLHCSPDLDVSRNVRSAHIENSSLKTHPEVSPACDSGSSTVITSKLIKDPRLKKREQVLEKQNGEAILDRISQCENELDYNLEMKVSATLSMPYPVTENFLLNSKNAVGEKQYMEKTYLEENLEGTILPSVLNRNKDSPVNGEQGLSSVNKNILGSQNTDTDHCLKTYVGDSSLKSKVCKTNNSDRTLMENVRREKGTRHSKLPSLHLNPSKTLINEWKFPDQNPESAAFGNYKMGGEMESQLQEDDAYISEMHCSTNLDTKCAQNNFTSSEEEQNDSANSCSLQDYTLQSEVCKKLHISENVMGEVWDEDLSEQSIENQMDAENFEQNGCHAVTEFEKFNKIEAPVIINKPIYTACEVANSSVGEKDYCTIEKVKDNSIGERIMHQSPASCGSDTVMRDFNGKSVCLPESVSLDKNIFRDSKECLLSSGIFVDEQRNCKTNTAANTSDFDQIYTSELEEKGKRDTPTIQMPSSTESSAEETSEKEDSVKEDWISDIRCCMETSGKPEILDSESSDSDFNFSGQGRGSTTEGKLINNSKEKSEDLHNQAFLTKGTDMVTYQEKHCTASVINTSVPVPLENIKDIEFKKPQSQSEISGLSNANFEELNSNSSCEDDSLEVFEQDLEVKCNDQNLNIVSDFENTLGECKKCISTSQKPCKNGNYWEKKDVYHYLQERMDWDSLLEKPSQSTKVSGKPSVEENKNDSEEKPELFVCPDLQITITNIIQPKLNSPHSSFRMKTDMRKCSGHKKDMKWLQEKNTKHHRRKEQNNSEEKYIFPSSSKGQVETFVQSEEYIKNVLNTLNTQALLCKNKHLSQKIDGAMFHLRKAHRRVQKSLKILAKAGRKKSSESSKSCEVLQCGSSSSCISDMPCSCDNMRNAKLTKLQTASEKSTSLDIMELKSTKPSSDKHIMSNEQKIHLNVVSGYNTQENISSSMVSTEHDISSEVNRYTSKDSAKHLNTAVEKKESCVNHEDKRKDERTCDSDINATAIKLATPVQAALESSAKVNILKPDNISIRLENVFSDENEALEIAPAPQIKISLSAKASSNDYELSPVSLENNCFSNEPFDNCRDLSHDIKHPEVGFEQKSLDFIIKISEILKKADETTSLNVLLEQLIFCRSVLPSFVRAFEKKQECSSEHVLVSREILESTERRMQTINKLKPSAIESLIELQIIMETIEFIENKKRLIEGVPTFRSLLWYDDSLCSELFGGESGYQQQSNFYPAFQRRLEYNALNELQSHHKQLVDAFNNTRWEHNSYYSFLKLRREIEECEQAMKSNYNFSDFFLSVPYVCGANFGDTLDDLEHARKNTVDLISKSKTPGINLRAEKEEHLWVIMDIIATKVEFIKTCEDVNIKASLFGLEHIFFDAAKSLAWTEKVKFINGDFKGEERQAIRINEADLSKLYETYQLMIEEFGRRNFNDAVEEQTFKKSSVDSSNCEMASKQQEANYCITKSLIVRQDIGCIGEILGEAQSSDTERLQQLLCRCTEHMEMLKQYFQILQEESDSVLITKENVLGFLKSGGINSTILKPEAVEVYAEMTMVYETVLFLQNSIARRVDKPRFRSLLWFDTSLTPELLRCQEKMASFSYRKGNLIEIIDSSISEIQNEWKAIHGFSKNLNCSYALHLFSRELKELSETKNVLQTSKSFSSMCVNLVPYTVSLNYGSTVSELEYNYNQFSSLLDKLMMCERKDLGKMAHVMKIMKTIEHMKFICSKREKSPLPLVIYQMVKNWRKSCELKRQDLDTTEEHSTKHSMCNSGPPASQASDSQSQHKRPASIASEDCSTSSEETSDPSRTKKIKIADSLMTTTEKINEDENSRNLRVSGKYNFPKEKELQLSISTDNMWNKKPGNLRETAPISPSQLKVAYPCESIQSSPNASEPKFICSNTLAGQQNLADLKDFNKSGWNAKDPDQEYIASHNEGGESLSLPSVTVELLQQSPENSPTRDGANSVLGTLNEHHNLKSDVLRDASHLMPECSTALSSPLKSDRNEAECGQEKNVTPNCTTPYNLDSTVMTEPNKAMELERLQMEPSYSENNKTKFSPLNQNEHIEETSQWQSSPVHIYGAVYPYSSWYLYQNHCNTHSVTQTYQELNSCEMNPLTHGMSTTTSIVYNTESSMFCSQTFSHFSVGDSQRFNLAQTYPMYGYFSSAVAFPYSNWQQPSWYTENQPWTQVAFPYPSNNGSEDYVGTT